MSNDDPDHNVTSDKENYQYNVDDLSPSHTHDLQEHPLPTLNGLLRLSIYSPSIDLSVSKLVALLWDPSLLLANQEE